MKILLPLLIVTFVCVGCSQSLSSELGASEGISEPNHSWQGYRRLNGRQIKPVFSNALDQATVVDGAGGTATNYWYSNGRFTSSWKVNDKAGQLSGTWLVKNDMRCVTLDSAVANLKANQQRCGPVYTRDGKYYSVNKSGGVHGVHVVTELTPKQLDASRLAD